ncbi:MAG: integration host factor subunit beta [Desulfuromonadales bacterium]
MNKSDLVETLANSKNLTYKKAQDVVNIIFDEMTEALTNEDRIEIRGFGSFVVRSYEGRLGRNPKTGEVISVKSKKLPFFKVGKELRERVDQE